MKIEGDFINDEEDDKNGFIKEYKEGILSTETEYLEEIPVRAKHYNEEGVLILDYKAKWIKTYYDNGNLKKKGIIIMDLLELWKNIMKMENYHLKGKQRIIKNGMVKCKMKMEKLLMK